MCNSLFYVLQHLIIGALVSVSQCEEMSIEITSDGVQQETIPENKNKFGRIALLYALQQEAQPIINKFELKHINHDNEINEIMDPMKVFSDLNQTIFVICNGNDRHFNVPRISTQAASINAFLTTQFIKPDLIISVGISGAITKQINDININIGDVFIAQNIMYHDRRIDVAPWSNGWHIGMYKTINLNIDTNTIKGLRDEKVIVSTGNAFPESTDDHQIWKKYGAHLTEMEAAAIAEICLEKNTHFTAIKGVSNFVDYSGNNGHGHGGVDEFEHHLIMTVNKLADVTIDIVNLLI